VTGVFIKILTTSDVPELHNFWTDVGVISYNNMHKHTSM